jgi:hypothetical protein
MCTLLAGLWGLSIGRYITYVTPAAAPANEHAAFPNIEYGHEFGITSGCVKYRYESVGHYGLHLGWSCFRVERFPFWTTYWQGSEWGGVILWMIPLWIPFLIFAVPTGLLCWRDRHRIPPGHCRKCGYNLTGNVSGICPECGQEI